MTLMTLLSGILTGTSVEYRARNENPQPIESYGSNLVMDDYKSPIVAILGAGIDKKHRDLLGHVIGEADFTDEITKITDSDNNTIYNLLIDGHDTRIAGIILGKSYIEVESKVPSNNSSVPKQVKRKYFNIEEGHSENFRLLDVKVSKSEGDVTKAVADGIIWATDHGANVINMSFSMPMSQELEDAVNYAWNHGVVLVGAAGNRGNSAMSYPASYKNCIAVAAED